MRLMCDLELNFENMSRQLRSISRIFCDELASLNEMEEDGLLELKNHGLFVTNVGRLLIRNIAMRFDAYLPRTAERRFSKPI